MSVRVGKLGIVRLKGDDLRKLREACFHRDKGRCTVCGLRVTDEVPDWHPRKYHMMHTKSRGAGGSDELSNVNTGCGKCHGESHNAGGKPCPKK